MRPTDVAISNYRSLLSLTVPMERLNLITGPNGSGKSNLYRALRLLAETALFLHRPASKLSPAKRKMLEEEQRSDSVLAGKKVLVIDDDVRNIFSLTSLLERYQMEVIFAENGRDGIELLNHTQDVDAILVDVMMPGIDGYDIMREIRGMRRWIVQWTF